jgi:single-strand DNA-binding protein
MAAMTAESSAPVGLGTLAASTTAAFFWNMFGNVNKVTLVGRLGADPEIRSTQAGKKVATLSVATTVFWKDRQSGQNKERTEWHRVVVFNDRFVSVIERVAQKGAHVLVEGSLQTRKWTDNNNVERYSTEIVLQQFQGDFQVFQGGKKVEHGQPDDPGYDDPGDDIPC